MKPLNWSVRFTELLQETRISAKMPAFLTTVVCGKHEWTTDGGLEDSVFLEVAADKTQWGPSESGP